MARGTVCSKLSATSAGSVGNSGFTVMLSRLSPRWRRHGKQPPPDDRQDQWLVVLQAEVNAGQQVDLAVGAGVNGPVSRAVSRHGRVAVADEHGDGNVQRGAALVTVRTSEPQVRAQHGQDVPEQFRLGQYRGGKAL